MKYLIIGLGNIGQEYADTRHNVGFMVVDKLAAAENSAWESGRYAFSTVIKHKGRTLQLIKPTTYMNLSGKAFNYWLQTLKIPIENTLTIVDDLALPFGALRMKPQGSSAGHNGLKDIEAVLGHQNYARLRFGIGNDYPKGKQADYVLGKFASKEQAELPIFIDKAAEMVLAFSAVGISQTMTLYNQ
jgi:peptidyl-tRNA hydrolase, PTH1 family